jgi:hypothetical protein
MGLVPVREFGSLIVGQVFAIVNVEKISSHGGRLLARPSSALTYGRFAKGIIALRVPAGRKL